MSNSLQSNGLQHARLLCPSPTPELTQTHVHWVGDAIQPSHPVFTFSSCLQSFSGPGSFPVSWLLASASQSTGASVSASVLPRNIQDIFPLGLTSWISLQSKGLSRVFSSTTVQKHQFFGTSFMVQLSHPYITTGKTTALTTWTFVSKVMSLLLGIISTWIFQRSLKFLCLEWNLPSF